MTLVCGQRESRGSKCGVNITDISMGGDAEGMFREFLLQPFEGINGLSIFFLIHEGTTQAEPGVGKEVALRIDLKELCIQLQGVFACLSVGASEP